MGFYGGKFSLDGVDGDNMYGAYLLGTADNGRDVGYKYELKKDDNDNYLGVKPQSMTIPFKMTFKNKDGNLNKLTINERRNVLQWIYPLDKNYKELRIDESKLCYFVKFQDLKWQEYCGGDVLSGNLLTLDGYCYTSSFNYSVPLRTSQTSYIDIDNYCNVESYYSPMILLSVGDVGGDVKIENETTNQSFTIKLLANEELKISCKRELMKSSKSIPKYNDFKGEYIKLRYGSNRIKCTGVNGSVSFICRYPMMME